MRRGAILPLLALSACGSGGTDTTAEAARLMETSREWSRVASTGNLDAMLAFWADDAVIMVPGEASLRGKQAIRAYLERSARVPGFRISWEPLEAKIAASGDMGYLIARTQVTMNDPSGQPVTQTMKALTVWQKQSNGSWKNVVDMTNPEPAR
jgi:uncharacterized protein (TIGR02246 family)